MRCRERRLARPARKSTATRSAPKSACAARPIRHGNGARSRPARTQHGRGAEDARPQAPQQGRGAGAADAGKPVALHLGAGPARRARSPASAFTATVATRAAPITDRRARTRHGRHRDRGSQGAGAGLVRGAAQRHLRRLRATGGRCAGRALSGSMRGASCARHGTAPTTPASPAAAA